MTNTVSDSLSSQEDLKGYLIGTVTSVADPENLGRIQATVPGLYSSAGELPWIGPKPQSPFGQGANYGFFGSPAVGSSVAIELQGGDSHKPLYVGGWRLKGSTPPEFQDPTVWGYQDPSGNKLVVKGNSHVFTSAGGVVININGGVLTITTPGNTVVNSSGDVDITAAGNVNVTGTTINLNS